MARSNKVLADVPRAGLPRAGGVVILDGPEDRSLTIAVADVPTLHDHWWPRPGWRPARLTYTWHLTFEEAPALHRLVAAYQTALHPLPGLCPVPARWLHLTVQSVGYVDQVDRHQLTASTTAVRRSLTDLAPFALTFHRPCVLREGVVLPAEPVAPVRELYDRIRDALASALGRDAVPTSPEHATDYLPHVTVAYSAVETPAEPYVRALRVVDPEPAVVRIAAVRLINQERLLVPEWLYRWTVVDTAPLGPR